MQQRTEYVIASRAELERTGGWSLVRRSLDCRSIGVNLVDIPPGESIPEHDETERDQEEVFFVVSGSPTLVIDGELHPAPEGTFARVDPAVRRCVHNRASEPCSLLIVSAPTSKRLPADGLGMTIETCQAGAMVAFPTVRVAAIQATPVILDAAGCVEKVAQLLHAAADRGARCRERELSACSGSTSGSPSDPGPCTTRCSTWDRRACSGVTAS